MTEKKMEIEAKAKASLVKLPRLKITPFKGTAADWVRFENMFITQVDERSISDEEKFSYLLESVIPKVRDRISNLKPSTAGYQKAWTDLKRSTDKPNSLLMPTWMKSSTCPQLKHQTMTKSRSSMTN